MAETTVKRLQIVNPQGDIFTLDPVAGESYDDATEQKHGLMSTSDKTKLDGIASGANAADIQYDPDYKKITKTINGTSSDVVSAATLKTAMHLNNVNNTSDADKPISDATQDALDEKIDSDLIGVAGGVAELDLSGKIPSSQLPSYVDDVLEYNSIGDFPLTGETGKIYIALDTNKTYRWGGSSYVAISGSLALGETSSTAYRGDRGKTAYTHATDSSRLTTAQSSGLYKIATTVEGHIASATAVQKSDITALGIPAQDTTYSAATTSAAGLMSATDKSKLDGIAAGATANTGTVTSVGTGVGLTGGTITGSGTIKANLTSETNLTNAAADGTETSGRVYPVRLDKNGKLAVNVPWNNTTYTFDGTYNASTNKAATVSTVTNAINALDGDLNSTSPGAGKTLTAFSETNGIVNAKFGNISITKSQVSDFPTLGAAAAKGVTDNSSSTAVSSTDTNLITGRTLYYAGYTKNAGTITGITMNGASKGTSGVVDLGTVITAHQDISGKADKSATVSNVAYDSTNNKITKTINGTTSDVVTASTLKTAMSLGNVENKSSATIRGEITSSNVTTALGFTPMNASLKGANNGVAELDSTGKVPASQLPSYVDDVLEYDKQSSFPATGEAGKIYVAKDTNKTYRWSGSAYVEISPSLALGETSSTAYRGDRGKTAYDHASAKGSAFASGLYKITTNSEGHVTAATAVAKSDITGLGIPAQDTNTHRPIQVNGTEILGDNTTALNLKAGSNVSVTNSSGTVTIAATDTTYSAATQSAAGLMSAADKKKLDGVATGATANVGTITGIKMNGASKGTSGVVDLGTVITAHQDISGKVSGPASATNNAVAIFDGTGGKTIKNSGFTIGKSVPSDAKFTDTTYSAATQSAAGLMSAADKTKLDGVATGATANVGTITGIKMNGSSKGTSGVVDLGTVITAHQTIPTGSTSAAGIVQLTDSVSSTSTTTAATPKNVKAAYDLANGKANKPTIASGTAASGSWSSATPPTQDVSVTGVTANNTIVVSLASTATSAQIDAAAAGKLLCTAQGAGTITLTCYGDEPSENIPLTVLILG